MASLLILCLVVFFPFSSSLKWKFPLPSVVLNEKSPGISIDISLLSDSVSLVIPFRWYEEQVSHSMHMQLPDNQSTTESAYIDILILPP